MKNIPSTLYKLLCVCLLMGAHYSHAQEYVAPPIKMDKGIALTLDACGGQTDMCILNLLIQNNIPSTLFVTGKWIQQNPEAITTINQHPNLFSIQNHGLEHKQATLHSKGAYNLPTVQTKENLYKEIHGNQILIKQHFPKANPSWYRTAGAL